MKIGIDARFLTHPQKGGFKTYSENLVNALAEIDQETEYILYLDRAPDLTTVPFPPNFTFRIVPGRLPMVGMFWREQVGLARQVAHDQVDLFHAPNLTAPLYLNCPLVLTVHDMLWVSPAQFSRRSSWSAKRALMEWYYRWVPHVAARHAALILTVSAAAKRSIVHRLGVKADQVIVTYEAANRLYHPIVDQAQLAYIRHQYKIDTAFILAIGSADPRKNLATLLQAFALLPPTIQRRYHLGIVWTHQFLTAEVAAQVHQLGLTPYVHFWEQVADADLVLLYNAAALFVFPSRYEGFGLPLVEAMACGTPVVAADNSSIPEVVGDAALLCPADDPALLAVRMEQVLTEPTLAARLSHKGRQRAAQFSWQSCARQTIAAYRYALQLDGASSVDPKLLHFLQE